MGTPSSFAGSAQAKEKCDRSRKLGLGLNQTEGQEERSKWSNLSRERDYLARRMTGSSAVVVSCALEKGRTTVLSGGRDGSSGKQEDVKKEGLIQRKAQGNVSGADLESMTGETKGGSVWQGCTGLEGAWPHGLPT